MAAEQKIPQTQYAEADGLSIAYQVFGSGPQDLVIVPGTISHAEADWEIPGDAEPRWRLAQVFRVIVFDKRGQGIAHDRRLVPAACARDRNRKNMLENARRA